MKKSTFVAGGLALALALTLAPKPTFAGTGNTSVSVSATVGQACTISTATNIAFGVYDPSASSDQPATGGLYVTCTKGATGVTVGLDLGGNATAGQRYLKGATSGGLMAYQLFKDAAHTQAWDNSANTYSLVSPTGAQQTVTIYATITKGQSTLAADSYADTVNAQINY